MDFSELAEILENQISSLTVVISHMGDTPKAVVSHSVPQRGQGDPWMQEELKERLIQNLPFIAANLSCVTHILLELASCKIITVPHEFQTLDRGNFKSDLEQATSLVVLLVKKPEKAFHVFVNELRRTGQTDIAQLLQPEGVVQQETLAQGEDRPPAFGESMPCNQRMDHKDGRFVPPSGADLDTKHRHDGDNTSMKENTKLFQSKTVTNNFIAASRDLYFCAAERKLDDFDAHMVQGICVQLHEKVRITRTQSEPNLMVMPNQSVVHATTFGETYYGRVTTATNGQEFHRTSPPHCLQTDAGRGKSDDPATLLSTSVGSNGPGCSLLEASAGTGLVPPSKSSPSMENLTMIDESHNHQQWSHELKHLQLEEQHWQQQQQHHQKQQQEQQMDTGHPILSHLDFPPDDDNFDL